MILKYGWESKKRRQSCNMDVDCCIFKRHLHFHTSHHMILMAWQELKTWSKGDIIVWGYSPKIQIDGVGTSTTAWNKELSLNFLFLCCRLQPVLYILSVGGSSNTVHDSYYFGINAYSPMFKYSPFFYLTAYGECPLSFDFLHCLRHKE